MNNVENMSDGDWNLISGHLKIFIQKLAVIGELNTNIANGIEDERKQPPRPINEISVREGVPS